MIFKLLHTALLLTLLMPCSAFSTGLNEPVKRVKATLYDQKNDGEVYVMAVADQLQTKDREKHSGGSIILIGASYAKGLKLETVAGYKLINRGVGGEQSFETLARFNSDVVEAKPDAVILWGFINDFFRSDPKKPDDTRERIKSSYIAMIDISNQNGIQPIVATEITMSMRSGFKEWALSIVAKILGKTSYQEKINEQIMQVNQWLKQYAMEKDIKLLDLQSLLADGGVMRKKVYAQKDGSHISEKGYAVISEYVSREIE